MAWLVETFSREGYRKPADLPDMVPARTETILQLEITKADAASIINQLAMLGKLREGTTVPAEAIAKLPAEGTTSSSTTTSTSPPVVPVTTSEATSVAPVTTSTTTSVAPVAEEPTVEAIGSYVRPLLVAHTTIVDLRRKLGHEGGSYGRLCSTRL
jgi:hypothetical protein